MDDATAIARCARGDREAFRCLVERYEAQAFGHALAITHERTSAQDAVQEALVDAWRSIARFDHRRRFYPWLYTLMRHRCYKALAARRRSWTAVGTEPIHLLEPAMMEHRDTALDLERALARLDPEERETLLLKHLDGLSYDEIAERIGVAPGTVMSRLYHIRQRLRALLDSPDREEGAR
jgi:RNA polymerase sigma-70 factor (ECF subfamily)